MTQRIGTQRIALRVFVDGALKVEDKLNLHPLEFDVLLPELAGRHQKLIEAAGGEHYFMIEIEFLDDPDPNRRFFRFGTDPRGMVQPRAIDLENLQ